ncbi:MAG: nucleotidyltransferase family protein [Gammaproteobacteria bacterium]|jgi:MurNAc alpha-1-phosphate uridylyltransferase
MKAMILAAGLGTRMRPLTLTTPKPLVKVRNQALIDYHLNALKKANVTDVAINVHHLGEQIIEHVERYWGYDFNLHFFVEEEILGTGGGVYHALAVFDNEPFIVVSADILTDYPFKKLPERIDGLAHLVMVDNPVFKKQGDFYLNDQAMLSLHTGQLLTYANIGVFHPDIFRLNLGPKFEMREVLIPAIEDNKISAEHYQGFWENIGTIAQLEALNS